jgi:hypothetical protein
MCVFSKKLAGNIAAWERIGSSVIVKDWILNGINIPFLRSAPPSGFYCKPYELSKRETDFVES